MNNYNQYTQNNESQEKWYESLFGIVILTVGLNLFSNWLYNSARDKRLEKERISDKNLERKRERSHLRNYHNKTNEQARDEEEISNSNLEDEE